MEDIEEDDMEYVASIIEGEGFDYAFVNYSSFDEVEDEEFHKLRKAFLDSREKLLKYIQKNVDERTASKLDYT